RFHSILQARSQRGLRAPGCERTIRRCVDCGWRERRGKSRLSRPPKDAIDGKPENLAPGESFFACPAEAKMTQRGRNLKAVIEPVAHHHVAVLSRSKGGRTNG